MLWIGQGCTEDAAEQSPAPVEQFDFHPGVFGTVECWLSDTASPVTTEINLGAVEANGNQFYWGNNPQRIQTIEADGQEQRWVHADDDEGFQRYRLLGHDNGVYTVVYQSNGGGSLTTSSTIGFEIDRRTISFGSESREIRVLRVVSYEPHRQ